MTGREVGELAVGLAAVVAEVEVETDAQVPAVGDQLRLSWCARTSAVEGGDLLFDVSVPSRSAMFLR